MAAERPILTFAEFSVIFAWSFVILETLCLLLLFYFLAYSGWVWYLVVETVLVGTIVCVETLVTGRVRKLLRTNKAFQGLQIVAFSGEAVALYGLGILYKEYETASYSWYFIVLLGVKIIPIALAPTVLRIS